MAKNHMHTPTSSIPFLVVPCVLQPLVLPAMDTLLSPAESHAIQNFLSAMDYQDIPPSDWALYTSSGIPNDDFIPTSQGSEALAKATKDLMSLDQSRWDPQAPQQHPTFTPHQRHSHQNSYAHRQMAYNRHNSFPFLNNTAQTQHPMISITSSSDTHLHHASPTSTSTPTSAVNTPATPHSPFAFSDPSSHPPPQLNQPLLRQRPPSPGTKRPSTPAMGDTSTTKRSRPSPPVSSAPPTAGSSKQSLLSPLQKKANHIQSEQKRRANIRRGYEALCEIVPALREAIREEEEAEARISMGLGPSGKNSRSKRKKKDAGEAGDKDKIDGRAGPRSENVVLSKTIDHINDLLSERSALLTRLHRAQSILPPNHPALVPACMGEPLWEREWKGGDGRAGGDDDDENDNEGGDSA